MSDLSGSRFLRMAGSDGFQQMLNRKATDFSRQSSGPTYNEPAIQRPDVTDKGGLGYTPAKGLEYKDTSNAYTPSGPGRRFAGSLDYSMFESSRQPKYADKSSSLRGPGSFKQQVTVPVPEVQMPSVPENDSDIFDIANQAVKGANDKNDFNIEAMDRSLRQRPLYHEAKGKLGFLNVFGDVARWSREELPEFKAPAPMEPVKQPDFGSMYDRTRDDLDGLKIK